MPQLTAEEQFRQYALENPADALRLIQKLRDKVVIPHPGQTPIVQSDARFKVVNCGRRWGKTVIAAKTLIDQTLASKPGSVTWWVAPTYKVVKRGYREVLRQLPREYLAKDPPPDTAFDAGRSVILKFKNGSQIEFYSAERPEGMLGEGVTYAVLDEAAIMPARIWQQVISPTLMDYQGGAMMISTPRGRNWFYQSWLRGQDPEAGAWASWTFPTASNPYIAEEEIQELEASLPRAIFQQEVLAEFIADGSSVFQWPQRRVQTEPVLSTGLVGDTDPKGQVFLGVDLAKTYDYTVLYGAREIDGRNVFYERFNAVKWSEQKRRIRRAVRNLMEAGAENVTLVMDSTGVGDPIVEDMEEAGFDVVGINFTTFKNKMVVALAKDLEQGKAWLLGDAHIVEFENYMMGQTPSGRITYSAPEGEHDDVVSAKMLSHWGITTEGSPSVQIMSGSGTELLEDLDPWDPKNDRNPEDPDPELDEGDFSDLVDDDPDLEDFAAAAEAVGLAYGPGHIPTTTELMNDPSMWV